MASRKRKSKLPKPKITLDRIGQITFTLKEVIKLAFRIKPKLLVAVFVLNAVWGASSVPVYYLEKLIIDKLVDGVGTENWKPVFYSIIFFVALSLLLSLFRNLLSSVSRLLERTLSRFFDAELNALLGLKLSELDLSTIESPDFRDRFNKIEREASRRAWGLMMPLSNIPSYLAGFISAGVVLVLVHPIVSIGVFVVSMPRLFINSTFIKKGYDLRTELAPKHRIWGWINYYLLRNRNFMELKILNITDYLTKKMKKTYREILNKGFELSKERQKSGLFGYLPLTIYEFAVSIVLVIWVITRKITIGSFQLYLRSLRSAEQNLSGLVSSFLEIYENYMYVTDLIWFLNLEGEHSGDLEKVKPDISEYSIEFDGAWFKYRDDGDWILKGIDLNIKQGEKIALVGENGAGKSTLIKLLAGFYHPQKGSVSVGNYNMEQIDLRFWRDKLAVLFQEFELYPFSVKEAIGYGDIERIGNTEEIKMVAKKTGVHDFVRSLPKKYDNPLAPEFEGGVRPSMGQWQRFGISRMLFRENAKILILDEPTSNVDPEAEEKIFGELVKITKGKILVFVTQRFSTVRIADRILVMSNGRIVEQGTHKELMKKDGKYKKMYNIQALAYTN